MKKDFTLNDTEIKINGMNALNKVLGPIGVMKFIALLNREPQVDSIELSKKLYAGQSVDQIFERASASWKKRSKK